MPSRAFFISIFVAALLVARFFPSPDISAAEANASSDPATVTQAAKLIELTTWPLVEGADEPQCRHATCLTYTATGKVPAIFALVKKQLTDQKWKPLPDAQATDQMASATFGRDGFLLTVSVYSAGTPGKVVSAISNLGNVALDKLPVPGKSQLLFPGAAGAAFVTDLPADKALEECRKLLLAKGWEPYGSAPETLVLKQNAMRLTARVTPAAGQAGKAMISYSAAMMSADLPAPADAASPQYNEVTKELKFDSPASQKEIVDFYRRALAKQGWKATTERPVDIDPKSLLVFTRSDHDLVFLEMHDIEGQTHVLLRHQTATEFDAERAAHEAEAKAKP
jgi:hypothetical protein